MSTTELSDCEEDSKKDHIRSSQSFDEEEEVSENAVVAASEDGLSSEPSAPDACGSNEEDDHRFLKLPVKNDDGSFRHVEGQCALCIDDYEVGDCVVWSDLECSHAYHKECLLQWLSKGKKRCPVCRHWFVPGARIEDQKKKHGKDWELANAEFNRIEEEEELTQEANDRDHSAEEDANSEAWASPDDMPCSTAEVADSVFPPVASESEPHVSALTLNTRSEIEEQLPSTRTARLVSIDTVQECTSSCCDASIPMNTSTESEEANESPSGNHAV